MIFNYGGAGDHLADRLSGLVDGELSGAEREAAERHLAGCPRCRAELDVTARLHAMVAGLPAMTVPPAVWSAIQTAGGRRPRVLVWAGAAAAVAGLSFLAAFPTPHRVTPQMAHLVQQHAILSGTDPVTQLAPAAVPASFLR